MDRVTRLYDLVEFVWNLVTKLTKFGHSLGMDPEQNCLIQWKKMEHKVNEKCVVKEVKGNFINHVELKRVI